MQILAYTEQLGELKRAIERIEAGQKDILYKMEISADTFPPQVYSTPRRADVHSTFSQSPYNLSPVVHPPVYPYSLSYLPMFIPSRQQDLASRQQDLASRQQDLASRQLGLPSWQQDLASRQLELSSWQQDTAGSQQNVTHSQWQPDNSLLDASQSAGNVQLFSTGNLLQIKARSSSRSNFAANMVRAAFSERVRASSNVSGKCGKEQLDPEIIRKIREVAFKLYPLLYGETEDLAWKKCRIAIDECCRRLNCRPGSGSSEM